MSLHGTLAHLGSGIITLWGIGHLLVMRSVLGGLGPVSGDHRRIFTMEWILEGLTLCFLGVLPGAIVTTGRSRAGRGAVVLCACAAMLLLMAVVSAATATRTAVGAMRICPLVKTSVAVLFVAAHLVP